MPNRRIPSAMTTTSTAWKKRDRRRLMKWLFQGQEERHEIDVLLRGQGLAEYRRHHALRKAGHRPHSRRIQAICVSSGPILAAPIFPAVWHATQAPLPAKIFSPAFGSPGSLISARAPPAVAAAPAVFGMSSSFTSTVEPSDSRNATSAHTSERLRPRGGLSTFGMMGG